MEAIISFLFFGVRVRARARARVCVCVCYLFGWTFAPVDDPEEMRSV